MVKIGDTSGNNAVGLSRDSSGWPPCPRGREASERPETWSRRGERELGGVEAAGEGATALTAVLEVLPSPRGGNDFPSGGNGEDEGVEAAVEAAPN